MGVYFTPSSDRSTYQFTKQSHRQRVNTIIHFSACMQCTYTIIIITINYLYYIYLVILR